MTIPEESIAYWYGHALELDPVVPCERLIELLCRKQTDEDIAALAVALGRHCQECRSREHLKRLYSMSEEPLRRLGAVLGLESHRKARVAKVVLQVAAGFDQDETVKAEAVRILALPPGRPREG